MTQRYGYSYLDMRHMHIGDPIPVRNASGGYVNMAEKIENTRFRSFAERYIIERASSFETGKEDESIWNALQEAKRAYHMIERAAREVEKTLQDSLDHEYQQALQDGNAAPNASGLPIFVPVSGVASLTQQIRKLISK